MKNKLKAFLKVFRMVLVLLILASIGIIPLYFKDYRDRGISLSLEDSEFYLVLTMLILSLLFMGIVATLVLIHFSPLMGMTYQNELKRLEEKGNK